MKRPFFILIVFLGLSLPCTAYVEPGIWSSLFQVLYFVLITGLAFVGGPLRALLAKLGWRRFRNRREEAEIDEQSG